jgi:two-component system, OmpR family, response regulator
VNVLVVDDHAELLELVGRALEGDGHSVRTVATYADAMFELERARPDLAILDLGLPDGSGESLCADIHENKRAGAILVLTAQNAVTSRVRCLDLGADDFLGKPFAVAELRARVRALARRSRRRPVATVRTRDVELDFARRRGSANGREVALTSREWSILELLASEATGTVVTRSDLLEGIWGNSDERSAASLEVLIGRIRKKLGADTVRTVRREGYAFGRD